MAGEAHSPPEPLATVRRQVGGDMLGGGAQRCARIRLRREIGVVFPHAQNRAQGEQHDDQDDRHPRQQAGGERTGVQQQGGAHGQGDPREQAPPGRDGEPYPAHVPQAQVGQFVPEHRLHLPVGQGEHVRVGHDPRLSRGPGRAGPDPDAPPPAHPQRRPGPRPVAVLVGQYGGQPGGERGAVGPRRPPPQAQPASGGPAEQGEGQQAERPAQHHRRLVQPDVVDAAGEPGEYRVGCALGGGQTGELGVRPVALPQDQPPPGGERGTRARDEDQQHQPGGGRQGQRAGHERAGGLAPFGGGRGGARRAAHDGGVVAGACTSPGSPWEPAPSAKSGVPGSSWASGARPWAGSAGGRTTATTTMWAHASACAGVSRAVRLWASAQSVSSCRVVPESSGTTAVSAARRSSAAAPRSRRRRHHRASLPPPARMRPEARSARICATTATRTGDRTAVWMPSPSGSPPGRCRGCGGRAGRCRPGRSRRVSPVRPARCRGPLHAGRPAPCAGA